MTEPEQQQTTHTGGNGTEALHNERVIIEKARTDPHAFAPIYQHYVGPVYRFCYRRLGTKELAEDATSQTFTQAIRGLEGFENRSFRAWLFSIAYRVVIDVYRKRRPDTPLESAPDPSDPAPTPEESLLAREDGQRIRALLTSLTDDQRRVLELRLAGLGGREIAETLGKTVGSVRLLQHRAIQRLRNLLNIDPHATEANDGA